MELSCLRFYKKNRDMKFICHLPEEVDVYYYRHYSMRYLGLNRGRALSGKSENTSLIIYDDPWYAQNVCLFVQKPRK